MTEHVEIRRGDSVASLVDELATSAKEDSLTLPADRDIAEGEWVRFTLKLADGTDVMEGVGQSRGSMPRGNPVDQYDLVLGELQFDERNEIMWERLLIAAEATKKGDETGTIQLGDGSIEELLPDSGNGPPARAKDGPPPPLPKASAPKSASSAPRAAGASNPPPPAAASKAAMASRPPPASKGHRLDVPDELVAQARKLSAQLPRDALPRTAGEPPEKAVLAAALRMGLAALEAQRG